MFQEKISESVSITEVELELLCNYLKKMDMKMIQKEQKRLCMILRKRIQKMQKMSNSNV